MTIQVHVVVMSIPAGTPVRVAALKARLSEVLRSVRRGEVVVVYDRDTPVARLVPYLGGGEPLSARPPVRALHDAPLPPPLARPVGSVAVLLEERHGGR
jgi:prevent-host-death family protein